MNKFETIEFKNYTDNYRVNENLFFSLYNSIPSKHNFQSLDRKKVEKILNKNKELEIIYEEIYHTDSSLVSKLYKIEDKILMSCFIQGELAQVVIFYIHNTETNIEELKLFKQFKKIKTNFKSKIGLLVSDNGSLYVHESETNLINLDIQLNYGEEFVDKHNTIKKSLEGNKSGIILLHSIPGAGKSTYIQYLCNHINRRFIFVPSNIAFNLASPGFIKILIENKDCVLVIEDAEKIIKSREGTGVSEISDLLNISDGILGNLLNTKIIATYNTKRENIDEALLRKGRLLCEHEFGKLSIENSKNLVEKLYNKEARELVKEDLTLAEIYHLNTENYFKKEKSKKSLGFKISNT